MSNPVAIITGGAGGMGAAAARKLADTHHVVIADLHEQKVAAVTDSIRATGAQATGLACNLTDLGAIKQLLQTGADLGELRALVHTAGVSPQMAAPDAIIDINAVATQTLVDAYLDFAADGAAAVLVASVAGLALPKALRPLRAFRASRTEGAQALRAGILRRVNLFPKSKRASLAYALSKAYVVWLAEAAAAQYGARGARIVSVSPGSFDTSMGKIEDAAGAGALAASSALGRFGTVEEMAAVLAFAVDPATSYLTGTDIRVDGGALSNRSLLDLARVSND